MSSYPALFIIVMLLVFVAGVTLLVWVIRSFRHAKRLPLLIFSAYFVLLLGSAAAFYILQPTVFQPDVEREVKPNISDADCDKLQRDLSLGKLDGTPSLEGGGILLLKKQSLPFNGSHLNINLNLGDISMITDYISSKPVNDGRIDVYYYSTPVVVNGRNITSKVGRPGFRITSDTLEWEVTQAHNIYLTQFGQDFPDGAQLIHNIDCFAGPVGFGAVAIRLPKGVTAEEVH